MDITIGIPTHNEDNSITKCLMSCLNQKTHLSFEIIVVASGCTDNTVALIEDFRSKDKRIKLIVEEQRNGKPSAMNIILKKARGNIIVHGGGDVIFMPDSVNKLVEKLNKNKGVVCVSGNTEILFNGSKLFHSWDLKTQEILVRKNVIESKKGEFFHICGDLFAHKKGVISEVPSVMGATDATMGSIIRKKGIIVFDPNIKCQLTHPNNVSDFIYQKSRIRYGFLVLNQKNPSKRNIFGELSHINLLFRGNSILTNFGFLFISLLYLASWIKAYQNFIKSDLSLEEVWKPVISTKKL